MYFKSTSGIVCVEKYYMQAAAKAWSNHLYIMYYSIYEIFFSSEESQLVPSAEKFQTRIDLIHLYMTK